MDSSRTGGNGSRAYYNRTEGSSVKVTSTVLSQSARLGRTLIILSFSFLLLSSVFASTAGAITRTEVLRRATSWVKHRVGYSQHRYYAGYRRDCSGFVSMAWRLDKSYTSRTISSRARRISISKLRPGDAVLTPGHVSLFAGWKNKSRREYIAIEQTTWGGHATRHVRRMPRRAVALRRRGIAEPVRLTPAASALAVASSESSTTISTTFTVASIAEAIAEPLTTAPLVSLRFASVPNVLV